MTSASPNLLKEAGGRRQARSREGRDGDRCRERTQRGPAGEPGPLRHLLVCPVDWRTQSHTQAPARPQSLPGPPMARAAALPPSRSSPTLRLLPLLVLLFGEAGERP